MAESLGTAFMYSINNIDANSLISIIQDNKSHLYTISVCNNTKTIAFDQPYSAFIMWTMCICGSYYPLIGSSILLPDASVTLIANYGSISFTNTSCTAKTTQNTYSIEATILGIP